MGSGIRIGRILGIPIFLHASWFIIFALITFSLQSQFRGQHPEWTEIQHWTAGILTSILFFSSVLFHEFAHSVVALRYKIPVISVTLFIFGGLARIGREPASAKQEFNIAVAGPLSSYFLAGAFYGVTRVFPNNEMVGALSGWLAWINFSLATFNLVPGFPLDGGRIFRAIVWGVTGSFTKATKYASRSGQFIAYLMILSGIVVGLKTSLFNGLWLAFIGWFLLSASTESYAQLAIRRALEGLRAADIMNPELPTVPRNISLEDYMYELLRTGRRCHFVTSGPGEIVGLMTVHTLNKIPREEWSHTSVQAAMVPLDKLHSAAPEEPVLRVLERMQNEDINQMPVVADGKFIGLITRDGILRMIQTRLELGELAPH